MQNKPTANNAILFAIPALIWGSTWYAITFQLGTVPPLYSIAYRFVLAGIIMLAYCSIRGISLRFSLQEHRWILTQALLLFGFNYWCTYVSEQYIASGLVAIIFSLVIFFNVFFGYLFLGNPIRKNVLVGAIFGLMGTVLVFWPELAQSTSNSTILWGISICFLGTIFASLGNITSARNQQHQLPVIPTNAFGMLYGGLTMLLIALVSGTPPAFETSSSYIISLIYLAIFGSIIAFGAYLTLVGNIGPDRAAYALVIVPVVAITISALLEDFQLTWMTGLGVGLLVAGNVFALRK